MADFEKTRKNLENRGFRAHVFATGAEAADYLAQTLPHAQVYLTSANAIAETGEIVNIDGYGNRGAPTIYGPQRVFLVVGKNKIAPDLNGAIDRARNIAAPLNARRLNRHTPCAVGEPRCHDCRSPEKICGVMTVFFMPQTSIKEFHVLLVNEDLGY